MILILTEGDTVPIAAKPDVKGVTVTPAIDPAAPASYHGLKPQAKAATDLVDTVWYRDRAGRVTVAKGRTAKPGTQVSLFHAAELFGISVTKDDAAETESPDAILRDLHAARMNHATTQSDWDKLFERVNHYLIPQSK